MTTIKRIDPLPVLRRGSDNFKGDVDLLFGEQLPNRLLQMNTQATDIDAAVQSVSDNKDAAENFASAAAASQASAAAIEQRTEQLVAVAESALAASVVPAFVAGQAVSVGDMRYSPLSFETYRAMTAGVRTVDPSNDADNWYLLGNAQAQNAALLWALAFN